MRLLALAALVLLLPSLVAAETGLAVFQPANNSAWLSSQQWNTTNWTASANLTELTRGTAVRWVRIANNPFRDELAIATLDSAQAVLLQFLRNTTNSSSLNITNATGDAGFRAFDLAVDGNGTLMAVAAANSSGGLVYRRWNGSAFENGSIVTGLSAQVNWVQLAARNSSAELMLVTQDSNSDLMATPWNGTAWLASQSLDNDTESATEEDFDVAYEPLTGRAIVAWANATTAAPRYRIYSGSWSSVGSVSTTAGQSANYEWLRLRAFPGSDRLLLCTNDGNNDLNCAQWDGSVWGTAKELDASIENSATTRRNFDLAPEPASGGWAVLYGDNGADSFSFARCQTSANCANGVWESVQTFWSAIDIGTDSSWASLEADPLLAGNLTALMTDQTANQWRGTITCAATANSCATSGNPSLLAASNASTNESARFSYAPVRPNLTALTASPSPILGGATITIDAGTPTDANNNTLTFSCNEARSPQSATNCTGGNTSDTSPYNLSCTYAAPTDTATHTVTCALFDGLLFSANATVSYATDSSPPSTAVSSVASDAQSPYYDAANDGWTNSTVSGESGMSCRWAATDLGYPAMSSTCTTAGAQATCGIATSSQGAASYFISCADSLGNSQNSTQNLDITSLVLDWTAPTTSDNSSSAVQQPPAYVQLTESDNVDGDPATFYCTDAFGNCTPTTSADSLTIINLTSRGPAFLRYFSSDDAGNNQSVQNKSVPINQLPSLDAAADNATTIGPGWSVNITTNASDPDSGQTLALYVCQTDSATPAGCAGASYCNDTASAANSTCSFTAESDNAAHAWYAFLFDSLDESALVNRSGTYTVDSAGPNITLIDPQNTTYSSGTVPVAIALNESALWAAYSLDSAANVTLSNSSATFWSTTLTGLADGQHNITFSANDTVGNSNGSLTRLFRVDSTATDTTPPTVTVLAPSAPWFRTANITLNLSLSEAASNASYALTSTNLSLGNISPTLWNATTASLSDGNHTALFYANDTATIRNTGSASASFAIDTAAPAFSGNGTNATANDTAAVLCHAFWSDSSGVDHAIVQENATGAAYNHTTVLAATSGWSNFTLNATALVPGAVQCLFSANDSAGNWNSSSVLFAVADATPPNLTVTAYIPNTTAGLDPGIPVNVTAAAADAVAVANTTLQYREANASAWTSVNMTLSSGSWNASFTPTNGIWTFRLMANDTANNINTSSETNLTVLQDSTWTNTTTIPAISSLVQTDPRVLSLGNLTLNATGDIALNFSLSSNVSFLSFNSTNTTLNTTLNASSANRTSNATFKVTANTTGFATGSYAYRLQVLADSNGSQLANQTIDGAVLIQNVAGPYLVATITAYETAVTQGATNLTLTATLQNLGTTAATDVWLNWSLPAGFSNTSGLANRSIGFLAVGATATNSIAAAVAAAASTGSRSLAVLASSAESILANDSKTVTVNQLGTTEAAAASSSSSGGGGGGTAGAAVASGQSFRELLRSTNETIDAVRGTTTTFPLLVKNIFSNPLRNLTLTLSGLPSRSFTLAPAAIPLLAPNSTASFEVTLAAPEYSEPGLRTLTATITATFPNGDALREERTITLAIQPVDRATLDAELSAAAAALAELESSGLPWAVPARLLERARAAADSHDYATALALAQDVQAAARAAKRIQSLAATVRQSIASAASQGLDTPETKDLLNLALAAAGREDFATAEQRLEQAMLLSALETKGRVNLLLLLERHWPELLAALAALALASLLAYRRLAARRITASLHDLDVEEEKIHEQVREAQRLAFEKKALSLTQYYRAMYQHEKRLDEIRTQRTKLRAKRIGLLSASTELSNLVREADRLQELMKQAQRHYYIAGDTGRKTYEARMRRLREREAELEAAVAVLEAHVAQDRANAAPKSKAAPAIPVPALEKTLRSSRPPRARRSQQRKPRPRKRRGPP